MVSENQFVQLLGTDNGGLEGVSSEGQIDKYGQYQSTMETQKRVFTLWCNSQLANSPFKVSDLYKDFEDGLTLFALLEALHGTSLSGLGKLAVKPRLKMQKVANLNLCFKHLRDTVKIVGIGETGSASPLAVQCIYCPQTLFMAMRSSFWEWYGL
jgi:hypothetical protein